MNNEKKKFIIKLYSLEKPICTLDFRFVIRSAVITVE